MSIDDGLTLASERDREIIADDIYNRITRLFIVEPVELYDARAAQLQAEAA